MTTPETQIKQMVKQYLDLKGVFNYPVLQGMGAYRGIPDRVMHYNGEVHYLEIKKPKGKLSPSQLDFYLQCQKDGIPYHVIKSLEDIQEIVP
uniref:Putative VRR-NUC domain-containing protein n=1 Tax=viral metagenome TaxID=1070528 RepID=A0A6M3JLZ3_9ZZZZ